MRQIAIGFCVIFSALQVQAVVLTPGAAAVASEAFSLSVGAAVASSGVIAVNSGTFTGNVEAWVYNDDTPGSGATDGLIFVYQFTRTGGTDSISRITHANFGSFITDVGHDASSGTNAPTSVLRSSEGGGVGNVVRFSFDGEAADISGTESSYLMVIKTNATTPFSGTTAVIDGLPAFAITFSPVPEPSFYAVLVFGLISLFGAARYRRQYRS